MAKKGYVLGGGGFLADGKQQYVLALLNLDTESPHAETIPLSFLGHGIVLSPQDRFRAAVFEKKGPGACLVDLRERCVLRPIPTPASRRFYGHGAYSADGSLLYATESLIEDDFAGVLSVRDAESLRELGCVPTHGASPHDCLLIDEGKTLVVSNGGGPKDGGAQPCVCYIELSTGKLLDKVVLDSPLHNTGHLGLSRRGDLAVISAPRDGLPSPNEQLGALSLRPLGGRAHARRDAVTHDLGNAADRRCHQSVRQLGIDVAPDRRDVRRQARASGPTRSLSVSRRGVAAGQSRRRQLGRAHRLHHCPPQAGRLDGAAQLHERLAHHLPRPDCRLKQRHNRKRLTFHR